ncbi:MAG: MaoC family dehydratase [Lautropia sp.]
MDIRARAYPNGFELPALTKQLTLESFHAFEEVMPRPRNLHNDEQLAKESGLGATVGSGTMVMSFLDQLMQSSFGDRWHRTGKSRIYLLRPLLAGDTLVMRAKVCGRLPEAGGTRIVFDVTAHGDGEKLISTGTSSVVVP